MLAAPTRPQMYRLQAPFTPGMTLMGLNGRRSAAASSPNLRKIVRAIDVDVAVGDVQPLERVVGDSIAQPRLLTRLLFGFGALALLLGAVGLYGVMAYGTIQRTREFGVRLALGARTGDVLGLVSARDALRLVGIGAVVGLVGALALSRVLKSQLYEVSPVDPFVFAGAAAVLAAAALAAALVPALRAARTDPWEALRWNSYLASAPVVDQHGRLRLVVGAGAAAQVAAADHFEHGLRLAARHDDPNVVRREDADELVGRGFHAASRTARRRRRRAA